jgi:hypothetical protein
MNQGASLPKGILGASPGPADARAKFLLSLVV